MQKAVRVTTIMKRLRAPEQTETANASPASVPAPQEGTENKAAGSTPPPESQTDNSAKVGVTTKASPKCNGEAASPHKPAAEAWEEQNG